MAMTGWCIYEIVLPTSNPQSWWLNCQFTTFDGEITTIDGLQPSFSLRLKLNTMSVCLKIEYPKIHRNLEVKLPTIWTDEKQRWEESERREEKKKEERVRRKEMQVRRKGRKVAKHGVFPMICGCGESKSRLAKAAGAEPSGQMRDEKLHAVVARSKFRSQNVQSTPAPDHFRKLICRKSARRCGAKHISKSTCTKHHMFAPLLKLRCWKGARRCGAKHISKSKVQKTEGYGALLDVQMSFCVVAEGIVHLVKSEQKVTVL